jgi:hypothetical protein
MNQRPTLEVLSWIAGIVSTCLAVYLFLKPEQTKTPAVAQSSPPAQGVQLQQPQPVPLVQKPQPPPVIDIPKTRAPEPQPTQRRLQDDPVFAALVKEHERKHPGTVHAGIVLAPKLGPLTEEQKREQAEAIARDALGYFEKHGIYCLFLAKRQTCPTIPVVFEVPKLDELQCVACRD